jgi:hypothetical protein
MKSSFPWYITPCGPSNVSLRFGEIYCRHHHGQRVGQARTQHEDGGKESLSTETSLNFTRLYGVIFPEDLFICHYCFIIIIITIIIIIIIYSTYCFYLVTYFNLFSCWQVF